MRFQSVLVIGVVGCLVGCGKGKDQPQQQVTKQEALQRIETEGENGGEHVRMEDNHNEFSLTHSDNEIRKPHVADEQDEHSTTASSEGKEHRESWWDRLTGKSHKSEQTTLDSGSNSDGKKKRKSFLSRFSSSSSSSDSGSSGSSGDHGSESGGSSSASESNQSEATPQKKSSWSDWNPFRRSSKEANSH